MTRRLFTLVIFLLLGTVLNVAVAWGCAAWIGAGGVGWDEIIRRERFSQRFSGWTFGVWKRPGALRILSLWVESREALRSRPWTASEHYVTTLINNSPARRVPDGELPIPSWSRLSGDTLKPVGGVPPSLIEDGHGWPLLSMRSSFWVNAGGGAIPEPRWSAITLAPATIGTAPYSPADLGPLRLENWAEPRVLSLIPIWTGFAVNTVFYAAIVWLLWSSPFAARRFIRHKRGLCGACGYDLRGDLASGCSECGWRREAEG